MGGQRSKKNYPQAELNSLITNQVKSDISQMGQSLSTY